MPCASDGSCDELGAIDHGASTDRQQKVQALAVNGLHCFHQGFMAWIGLDAAELHNGPLAKRGAHLIQGASTARTFAAVEHQDPGAGRHQRI
jgi:hypothetical protein